MIQSAFRLFFLLLPILAGCTRGGDKQPVDLRCMNMENPLGFDDPGILLSWKLSDTSRGALQTAYRILVSSDPRQLRKGIGDVWDSKKTGSDRSTWVPYGGPPVQSRQRCYWKVRVWDQHGEPSGWSKTAWWETGLLQKADWKAKWIGMDLIAEDSALVKYGTWITAPGTQSGRKLYVRRTFGTRDGMKPRRAFFHLLGEGHATVILNGTVIREQDFNGNVAVISMHENIREGENSLAISVDSDRSGKPSLIFYMEMIFPDGQTQWISSGGQCKASGKSEKGWKQDGFDDSAWSSAEEGDPFGKGEHGWIAGAGPAPRSTMIRKEFTVPRKVARARAYVSGLGNYRLFVNGKPVGKDLLTPGWTDYNKRVQYQVYDLDDFVVRGKNAAGLILGNMWWSSGLGWSGGVRYSQGPVRGFCQIELEYADGSMEQIATDGSWMAHTSPILENTLYNGEKYDARLEIEGWSKPGLDLKHWMQATVFHEEDSLILSAQKGPPIRIAKEIEPAGIKEVQPGKYVFDMGRNLVGCARLRVSGEAGQEVVMRFAENLHEDGTVAQENLRSAQATDRYILRGDGEEVWQPSFTYHGFRYVQVEGYPGKPENSAVTGLQFYSSAERTGYFKCSNELINKIYGNILNGQQGNMESVPTDCPQRDERLGWTGDAQMFSPTACYNMNMDGFFSKWLRDMTDSQTKEGWIFDVNPAIVVSGPGKPAWADAVTIVPWNVYKFYGDNRIIEDNYKGMKAWVDYMISKSKDRLYIFDQNGWAGYGDWIAVVSSPGKPISAAYYYYSTRLLSGMAARLGMEEDAWKYSEIADNIKMAFNKKYFDKETGNYESATQTANLLPLAFGIAPPEKRQQVADNIAADVIKRGKHPSTGFLGTGYILPMLSEYGYHDLAYEVACQRTEPSWGYMVDQGATSIWELWNSDSEPPDQMNSRNHFALGSVGEWFYAYLAGIQPDIDAPGFKHSIIRPMPAGDLNWAEGRLNTSYGPLACSWELKGGDFNMKVVVPPNTTATIAIPLTEGASTISEQGTLIWSAGKKPGEMTGGLTYKGEDPGSVTFAAAAGTYRFTVK